MMFKVDFPTLYNFCYAVTSVSELLCVTINCCTLLSDWFLAGGGGVSD